MTPNLQEISLVNMNLSDISFAADLHNLQILVKSFSPFAAPMEEIWSKFPMLSRVSAGKSDRFGSN